MKRVKYVEFARDIHFRDRRGTQRCFHVEATIPIFYHKEELLVSNAGDPTFNLITSDSIKKRVTENDLEDFMKSMNAATSDEYDKVISSKIVP